MSVEFDSGKRLNLVDETVNSDLVNDLVDYAILNQWDKMNFNTNILTELNNNATVKQPNTNINLSWHSSFEKLINAPCFVFRFLKNLSCKMKNQNQCFNLEERDEAINPWKKYELDCLLNNLTFKNYFRHWFIWRFAEYFTVERKIWQFIIRIRSEISYYIGWLWKLIYKIVDCWYASKVII